MAKRVKLTPDQEAYRKSLGIKAIEKQKRSITELQHLNGKITSGERFPKPKRLDGDVGREDMIRFHYVFNRYKETDEYKSLFADLNAKGITFPANFIYRAFAEGFWSYPTFFLPDREMAPVVSIQMGTKK